LNAGLAEHVCANPGIYASSQSRFTPSKLRTSKNESTTHSVHLCRSAIWL
jgi:hypothetical protein